MKNLIKFLAVLVLIFGYTSCDELDKLTEVDLSTTVTKNIPVTVDDGAGLSVDISNSINSIDINIGDYIDSAYLSKIEEVKINSMTYKVINFSGDTAGVMTANLTADGVTLDTHTDVIVSNVVGEMYPIDDTAKLTTIANNLKNSSNDVVFAVSGTSINDGGMTFTIEITLNLKITADAL